MIAYIVDVAKEHDQDRTITEIVRSAIVAKRRCMIQNIGLMGISFWYSPSRCS